MNVASILGYNSTESFIYKNKWQQVIVQITAASHEQTIIFSLLSSSRKITSFFQNNDKKEYT